MIASRKTGAAFWICVSCLLLTVAACRTRMWPAEEGFPDREIVFVAPTKGGKEHLLGFIHPDGSGYTTRRVTRDEYPSFPTWSLDGTQIAFRSELKSGSIFSALKAKVISADGRLWPVCREWEWSSGRVWVVDDTHVVLPLSLADEPRERVVLADHRSCKIVTTLYTASGKKREEYIFSASLSVDEYLAVGRLFAEEDPPRAEVVVVDPVSGQECVVGQGLAPAWSRDGEWLAYTGIDGIYVVRRDGTDESRVVELNSRGTTLGWYTWLPMPSWSPDGKWLVYHKSSPGGASICKVNLESGVETVIYYGGTYPDWRWDLPVE